MSKIYETLSLQTKSPVRLCERTSHTGLRYVIFKGKLIVAECNAMCDAYRAYNKYAAL